jgi:hypothetical protein
MDIQFQRSNNHQRFVDCSLWSNYLSELDACSPEKLIAAVHKYFTVGKGEQLFIPLHLANHFMLIVISFDHATIEVYDSLDFDHKN